MRIGTPGFLGERLVEARESRCIATRQALASLLGKNGTTIGRWEDGSSTPEPEALLELAATLNLRPEYFLRPMQRGIGPVFFRSLASTLRRDLGMQRARIGWLQEISFALQHYVDLPSVNIPNVLAGMSYRQLRDEDLDDIALELRRHWGLGNGPAGDMVELMERVGFVVGVDDMGTSKLDGLCQWSDAEERPYVLLANDKMCFPRRQMDAAHEMSHAILHRGVTEEDLRSDLKLIEHQAFRLASAFLLPATSYPIEVGTPSLARLLVLKERWRVSVKAQIMRLKTLDLIDGDHAVQLYKIYSAKGWSRQEPYDDRWPLQRPRALAQALDVIVANGVRSKADLLACEFVISASDVERLLGLSEGWFQMKAGEIVNLKDRAAPPRTLSIKDSEPGLGNGKASTVIAFNRG